MKTLRIGSGGPASFDLACLEADHFVLWRQDGEVLLGIDDRRIGALRRALALRGVRTSPAEHKVPGPPPLLAAIGIGLAPARLRTPAEVDLLDIRVVPLCEATARLTRRRIVRWPRTARSRARCRALLRGTDALFEVRRQAWCERTTLGASRRSLRPLLFDRSVRAPALPVYASDGALARWVNG